MAATILLTNQVDINFYPKAPFNFDASFYKPDHFPSGDHEWQPGVRLQTMLWQGIRLGLVFRNQGSLEAPWIKLSVFSEDELVPNFLAGLQNEVIYRYNLQMDLGAFNRCFDDNPVLGPVIQRWRGMRPMNYVSLYEYLMIAIVLQNATVRRSVQMLQALFEAYGCKLQYDNKILHCCWEPETIYAVAESELRSLKVGYRAKSILRVTEAFARHEINEFLLREKTLDEQRLALLGLYGIGPASVGYLLFDVFHQMDELRHISPWEQKIYSRLFYQTETHSPVAVEKLLEHFQQNFTGYRMLAVHYIWEDLFWKRKNETVGWLEELIRL